MKKVCLSAFAMMLCIGGITACAQPPLSSQSQPEADDATFELGARAAAAADAAAMGSGSENGDKEKVPVTTETMPEKAVGPPIASTLLQERILRLVDSLRSSSNVTRHHVEEVMQVKLEQDAEFKEWWWYTGATDEGWEYTVMVDGSSKYDVLPLIKISFSAGDVEADKRATVCTYELEPFARSLTDLGYTRYPRFVQPGGQLLLNRETKSTQFSSSVRMKKYVQQTGKEASDFQHCVYVINISAGESIDGE